MRISSLLALFFKEERTMITLRRALELLKKKSFRVIKKKFDAAGLLSRKRLVVAITTEKRQTK